MKIAYLMLVHQNPRLLKRAVAALSCDGCGFFIHVDQRVDARSFSDIGGNTIFFCKQRVPVYWGEFSLVQATLMLMREALGSAEGYDYFVLLSGSDYPLRAGTYIRRFLKENRGSEFINLVKMPAPGFPLSKINKLRYPSDKPARRFASRTLAKIGLAQRDFRRSLRGLDAYGGTQWWTISRDAAQYIAGSVRLNPHLEKYFQKAFTSDEMFFHTILGNSPFRTRVRRSLVYLDWHDAGNHPRMLTDEHVRFFESREKIWVEDEWGSGEVLFARKFSDESLDLVDRIDEMIRRKEELELTPFQRGRFIDRPADGRNSLA